jgi:hypothetical protein
MKIKNALAAVLLPLTLFTSSCTCWTAAHAQEQRCVVAHQVLSCVEQDVAALIPHLVPVVSYIVQGANGTMDWSDVTKSLEAMGFQTAACSLAQLENDFGIVTAAKAGLASASPTKLSAAHASLKHQLTDAELKAAHEAFVKWMAEKHPGVKVKIKLVDGTEKTL